MFGAMRFAGLHSAIQDICQPPYICVRGLDMHRLLQSSKSIVTPVDVV